MAKQPFDIHNCYVEYIEGTDGKPRPILVIDWGNINPDLVYFYKITSQYDNKSPQIQAGYYPIKKWKEANLDKASYIDIYKLEVVSVDILVADSGYHRGRLHDDDIKDFTVFYQERESILKGDTAS